MSEGLSALTEALMARDKRIAELEAEKVEREQGCEWCVKGENRLDGEDMEIELMHTLKKESRMVYPIFCPMCGRKLGEDWK